jgi:hypothetical protein
LVLAAMEEQVKVEAQVEIILSFLLLHQQAVAVAEEQV